MQKTAAVSPWDPEMGLLLAAGSPLSWAGSITHLRSGAFLWHFACATCGHVDQLAETGLGSDTGIWTGAGRVLCSDLVTHPPPTQAPTAHIAPVLPQHLQQGGHRDDSLPKANGKAGGRGATDSTSMLLPPQGPEMTLGASQQSTGGLHPAFRSSFRCDPHGSACSSR